MHRESGLHLNLSCKGLLPAALMILALGCGGGESSVAEAPESVPAPSSETSERGATPTPAPTPIAPGVTQAAPWFHRLGGPQDDLGTGLAVDATGHVSVVWVSTPRQDADRAPVPGERLAFSLTRYSAEGQLLWTRDFLRDRVDAPRVVAAPSGELFLSGNAFLYDVDFGLGTAASDGFLVEFSPDGHALWQRRVGQKVYGTVADASGGVFVAAEEWTDPGHVVVLAHYDAQGRRVWTRSLGPVSDDTSLHALALTPSGRLLLAGRLVGTLSVEDSSFGSEGGPALVLLAFGPDGGLVWGRQWKDARGDVTGLASDAQGGAVLVSEETVRTTGPDGAERWARPLACDVSGVESRVTVDEAGRIVTLCGATLSTYSAQGEQQDEQVLPPVGCDGSTCPLWGTALAVVPGRGLALTGAQRYGGAVWDQEAFVRFLSQ